MSFRRALPGLADRPAVYHYAADAHALELRCVFDEGAWERACGGRPDVVLVALTSIHWREAWKYGERAFRYCQHDLGHASAAVSMAAGLLGWRAALLPSWSHSAIAAVDRHRSRTGFSSKPNAKSPAACIAVTAGEPLDCSLETAGQFVDAVARAGNGQAAQVS